MYSVKFSEIANQDLVDIFDLIAKDKPSIAIEYIDKLETMIDLLSDNPRLGVECKNKNRIQNYIYNCTYKHCIHCYFRIPLGSNNVINAKT